MWWKGINTFDYFWVHFFLASEEIINLYSFTEPDRILFIIYPITEQHILQIKNIFL